MKKIILTATASLLFSCGTKPETSSVFTDESQYQNLTINGEEVITNIPVFQVNQSTNALSQARGLSDQSSSMKDLVTELLTNKLGSWIQETKANQTCVTKSKFELPMRSPVMSSRSLRKFNKSLIFGDVTWCINSTDVEKAVEIINDPQFKKDSSETVTDVTREENGTMCLKTKGGFLGLVKATHSCSAHFGNFTDEGEMYVGYSFVVDPLKSGSRGHKVFLNDSVYAIVKLPGKLAIKQLSISRGQNIPGLGRSKAKRVMTDASKQAMRNLQTRINQ